MKTLYLVRHAKSSWEFDVIDHERPLNKRGFKDAKLVSKHLKDKLKLPDLVMSSDAMRAKTTAYIFMKNLGMDEDEVVLNHQLYDFSGRNLTKTISDCDDDVNTLMVFGHNHAMTSFVNAYGDKPTGNVATSGFTHIEFDIDSWKDLKPGKTKISLYPKQLKN
ncbi:MAG: phosphoglycerate mutase [Flavobacteriaceae bacterium]|nr:histidine phosphatase family protein [Bacteroidia bacterium]NND11314.1 phosphoglycerate mutase [Flavobacteriaceae bacterium]NNK28397.1 phosphoglycerate mutase [Flavobacteriaceae bacterium]NNL61279.1 phosphoglycerate mutase [Flavobacteriaceae bacterium]